MVDKRQEGGAGTGPFPGFDPKSVESYVFKDPQALTVNLARAFEHLGQAASEWLGAHERKNDDDPPADPLTDLVKTMSQVIQYWVADPKRTLDAQTLLFSSYMGIWTQTISQFTGNPVCDDTTKPGDKRFLDEDWGKNPFFAFLRQTYSVTAAWAERLVAEADGMDDHTRHKAQFYVRQLTAALSPANFAFTNPEVYRQTVSTSGQNLVEGMRMLAEDVTTGSGHLRLRQTDDSQFKVGKNLATTPGKVIAKNEICEVIQYEASTQTVLKRPLLIVPPWINKFYILDLTRQKSFIKWCVDQGHSVFVISWVNPDRRHALKGWEAYIDEGIEFALNTVQKATGERKVNAIGYCVGGTLLAAALALHAKRKDRRIASATFLTTQVDFTFAGDLKVFVDEEQVRAIEREMDKAGFLDGAKMANAFNMLRASELIWPYVVNNYLMGKTPPAFDLLYWNADSTRMAAANHAFYLRNCYLDNRLSQGRMELAGDIISLKDIKIPVFNLATKEDHIAPARSVFHGSAFFGGPIEFVLSGSGHIAGVVNPPDRHKYHYWTGGAPDGDLDHWLESARQTTGSWWPHWQAWILKRGNRRVPPRIPGGEALTAIADAPGTYVLDRI